MKKNFLVFLVLPLLFLAFSLLKPHSVFAKGECDTFNVNPTSGSTSTVYTATATGCLVGGAYQLRIVDKDDNVVNSTPIVVATDEGVIFTFSGLPDTGTYTVYLIYGAANPILVASFSVTVVEELGCFSQAPPNAPACPPGAPGPDCCPKECPSVICELSTCYDSNDPIPCCQPNTWTCGGEDESYTVHIHCYKGDGSNDVDKTTINSAIGCIPIETNLILWTYVLQWAIGIGGGISFLILLLAGFLYITSAGDPKKLQAAKELTYTALSSIIMLIFSVYLIRIIGIDILGIISL